MKKTINLTICLLLFAAPLSAQIDNFLPGYVITLSGDTLQGKILYKGNRVKNDICHFRPEGQDKEISYSPKELILYGYNDEKCYVPLSIPDGEKEQTVFVEYLLNGIVSIYYYGFSSEYFVKDENGTVLPLTNEEIEVNHRGNTYRGRSQKYLGVLKYVFTKDIETIKKLNKGKIELKQTDLISIGKQYHDAVCTEWECVVYDKEYNFVKKKERNFLFQRLALGVFSGLNYNFVPFSERFIHQDERFLVETTDVHTAQSFYPTIGLFVNCNLFFIHPKLDVRYEFSHHQQHSTTGYKYISGAHGLVNRHYDYEATLKKKCLNNTVLLKYNFQRITGYDMYVQGGYTLSYLYKYTFQQNGEYRFYRSTSEGLIEEVRIVDTERNLKNNIKFEHRACLGLGFSKKINALHLFGDIRYQICFNKMIAWSESEIDYRGHDISLNLGIGFFLAK